MFFVVVVDRDGEVKGGSGRCSPFNSTATIDGDREMTVLSHYSHGSSREGGVSIQEAAKVVRGSSLVSFHQ